MTVIVYVEGASDKQALTELLRPLLQQKQKKNVCIRFIERASKGDILKRGVRKALMILRNRSDFHVVLLPDLYPPNAGDIPHETVDELEEGLRERLHKITEDWTIDASQIDDRLHIFCLKYELEALILAAKESLRQYLNIDNFHVSWAREVEDQNHDRPPETVVREIFEEHRDEYVKEEDAPEILGMAEPTVIAQRCPQQFGPFLNFLTDL
jgi:hypothetical protein